MPIAATIASEFAATGRPSTRRFQTFEAGKIGQDESDGGGPGVGVGAGGWVGAAVGLAVGVGVVVGEAVVGGDVVMIAVAVGEADESASVVGLWLVAPAGFEARTWLGVRAATLVDGDAVGPFCPLDNTGTGRGLARATTATRAASAPSQASAVSRFPRSDMTPA